MFGSPEGAEDVQRTLAWTNAARGFLNAVGRGRYWLASVLGAFGGPLAYYGGQRRGAIKLGRNAAISLLVIAVEWTLVTSALVGLSGVLMA